MLPGAANAERGKHIQTNQQDHHKCQTERERCQRSTQIQTLSDQRADDWGQCTAQCANVVGKAQARCTLVGIEITANQFGKIPAIPCPSICWKNSNRPSTQTFAPPIANTGIISSCEASRLQTYALRVPSQSPRKPPTQHPTAAPKPLKNSTLATVCGL